jgi:pyridoxamine 5'-phosphate oxidase
VLGAWLDDAALQLQPHNPTAMTLATVNEHGQPRARMVICRGYDADAGWLVFYTDRTSPKGHDLAGTPRASLVFYWDPLQRQVRIDGPVSDAAAAQADAYFASRPVGAQLAAWASEQSRPLADRAALERRYEQELARFGLHSDGGGPAEVPRPEGWGGYRVWIERIEFWVGRSDRLHDRALYTRELEPTGAGFKGGAWQVTRLQP